MAWNIDARVPVLLAADAGAIPALLASAPGAALLVEAPGAGIAGAVHQVSFAPAPAHLVGCACCGGRPAAAVAFDRLFLARVRGECPWFDRVIAWAPSPAGRAAIDAALADDAATAARFRPG